VRELSTRAIWLQDGQVVMDGPIDTVLAAYRAGPR
jgi:ABC-type polysaccharide/polyol phosphate transport system ATPase subunit